MSHLLWGLPIHGRYKSLTETLPDKKRREECLDCRPATFGHENQSARLLMSLLFRSRSAVLLFFRLGCERYVRSSFDAYNPSAATHNPPLSARRIPIANDHMAKLYRVSLYLFPLIISSNTEINHILTVSCQVLTAYSVIQ